MKTLFLNLVIFLITLTMAKGQTERKYHNSLKDTPKFIGTWIAKSDGNTIKIVLKEKPHQYVEQLNIYMDKVEGTYSLIDKQNNTLYGNEENNRIESGQVDYNDKNILNAIYVDRVSYMTGIATFKFDPKTKSLQLSLVDTNEADLIGTSPKKKKKSFNIPKDILFTKFE
jgi:hypothetical protein